MRIETIELVRYASSSKAVEKQKNALQITYVNPESTPTDRGQRQVGKSSQITLTYARQGGTLPYDATRL
jgi:hypothetical protein